MYRAGIRCEIAVVQRLQAGTIILSKSKHFGGGKWGLADTRKPDDGLRKRVPVLPIPCGLDSTRKLTSIGTARLDGSQRVGATTWV